ncbi:MAG: beta-phosphoglucomutase [Chloroflexi bacterium]|jgi:beta-phosphoglucomutase|nr:beta-phosphoglucomutase [Chloroflexota bacterium]
MLKAVIFDMDGVLTATVEYHYRSWKKVCDEFQIPFGRPQIEKLLGLTRRRALEVILDGRRLPEEQMRLMLEKKNTYFLEYLREMGPADLMPGAGELVQELNESGILIGVASASRNARPVLKRLGIAHLVDAIADSKQARRSKPAPDVFLEAASLLKVQPFECLAIEDSRVGVQAALDAGMCVVGLGPTQRVGKAHAVISSLAQVGLADLVAIYNWWDACRPEEVGDADVSGLAHPG